jgi:hypothetical protein
MNAWDKLQFLVGNWSSPVSGQPGQGISGSTSFAFNLDQKILVRKSRAEFTPEPGQIKGLVHDDLLIIYQQPGESLFRAIYFDNEGHIIHYAVVFPEKQPAVVFESEASEISPRARLVYQMAADGTLETEFSVAAPGGALLSHVKGTLKRVL